MKEIHVILDDEDHKALLKAKDGLTWREILFKILEPNKNEARVEAVAA